MEPADRRWIGTKRAAAALAGLAVALLGAELAARVVAERVLHKGALYRADTELGWSLAPRIDVERRLQGGSTRRVRTDANGHRIGPADDPDHPVYWSADASRRRVLIVGDSFAESYVDIEQRLDRQLGALRPRWSVAEFGCRGYGPSQWLALGHRFDDQLRSGDAFVALSCGNDYPDLLRRSHAGRTKPYYTLDDGAPVFHPAHVAPWHRLRDRSYLAGQLITRLAHTSDGFTDAELAEAQELMVAVVRDETRQLTARGVRPVFAHHSDAWAEGDVEGVFPRLAAIDGLVVVDLDAELGVAGPDNPLFLPDGHWTPAGEAAVAAVLAGVLD